MINEFDVAVIGSGPAGSAAARLCAEKGLRTVLIEKSRIPRLKPCAGFISSKALKLINSEIPQSLIDHEVKGLRFYSKSLSSILLESDLSIGISTARDKFDAFLVDLAISSGSQLIQGNGLAEMSIMKDKVECKLRNNELVESKMVIGADGAKSTVAMKSLIRQKWKRDEVGFCLEANIPLTEEEKTKIESEIFEIYFIDIPMGYGWFFPKKNSVSVGIGGCLAHINQPRDILNNFCKVVSKIKKINLVVSDFSAHLAPAGGFKRQVVAERVMLVGDAAGFIDPFTGEGIYYALRSGQIAANTCVKSIKEENYAKAFLKKYYEDKCEQDFGKDLKIGLNTSFSVQNHFDSFFDALKQNKSWFDIATGNTNYRNRKEKSDEKNGI